MCMDAAKSILLLLSITRESNHMNHFLGFTFASIRSYCFNNEIIWINDTGITSKSDPAALY